MNFASGGKPWSTDTTAGQTFLPVWGAVTQMDHSAKK